MIKKKYKSLIVVHNDEVYWAAADPGGACRCLLHLPLEQLLESGMAAGQVPKIMRGDYKSLCIVPDHWFGLERYPFKSRKQSLIEPFLAHKLTAAYPDSKEVSSFFSYRCSSGEGEDPGLCVYFLQEPKGFQLYSLLKKMKLCPRRITTPAFLWMDKLARACPDFDREGVLFIHINRQECLLYFYFKGNFLFSRNVTLQYAADDPNALTFEINQSLYMFAQKAKSDLNRFYLLADPSVDHKLFSEMLGRNITDIRSLLEPAQPFDIGTMPFLDQLLQPKDLTWQARFVSVIHRQVKRELEWESVQWAAILTGLFLLLPVSGENLLLARMLAKERLENQAIQAQSLSGSSAQAPLAAYDAALDRVIQMAERPAGAESIRRLLASLPPGFRVRELDLTCENQPALTLTADVPADNAEHLKDQLAQLVANVRASFTSAQALSIDQIDIRSDPSAGEVPSNRYQIGLRLNMI